MVLAIAGGDDAVKDLASATGLLLLLSFMVVNSALIVLKLRPGEAPGSFEVLIVVPLLGIVVNATLIAARLSEGEGEWRAPKIAGAVIGAAALLYFVIRPTNVTEESLAAVESEA